jgi:hypothetical protein
MGRRSMAGSTAASTLDEIGHFSHIVIFASMTFSDF